MVAVCHGNRKSAYENQTCDARRGNKDLKVNPLREDTLSSIYYSNSGYIKSDDETVMKDLNDTLNLNCVARDLVCKRRSVLNKVKQKVNGSENKKRCCEEILRNLSPNNEFVGIARWWLMKKIENMS